MDHSPKPTNYVPYQPGFERKVHYRNFIVPVHHPLYGIVSDFYQFEVTSILSELFAIPDGCIDLLFRFDRDGVTKTLEGYHLKKIMIPINQAGSAFGVRFTPGGLTNIIKVQTSELIGRQIPLTDVLKTDRWLEQMDFTMGFGERIAVVTKFLMNKMQKGYGSAEIVRYCTDKIISNQGNILIGDLSRETGYTIRYLRNLYQRYVGISPKEFCEIIQFQASLLQCIHLIRSEKNISLCDIAANAGYYDQSHMNKCYYKMVGCLPQKFYKEIK